MIIYKSNGGTSSADFWQMYDNIYSEVHGTFIEPPSDVPPATPNEFIAQKLAKIAGVQTERRNARIKPWEDKRKQFR